MWRCMVAIAEKAFKMFLEIKAQQVVITMFLKYPVIFISIASNLSN